ncbi:NAD(P)H-hydrate epimerase [Microbacterium sp. 4R-513]|uniref:NAD(P)H-hydrate epimerase n=1 Tax=Microbacterium sp. 4R-513 TaxID=2567934 RepID=UPI0013E1CC47|nr:NAD(P)H-hydrate epimerase [Microbacterium sp. 4R-513]QIG40926.1 NAD(P)H-hydrate epimerase [Microbacterium sp. 4R-513]
MPETGDDTVTGRITVPAYTADQVRAAEQPLLEAGEPLMRRAAAALAHVVQGLVDEELDEHPEEDVRVLVLAGSGDNGGDALFAAAALQRAEVHVLSTGKRVHEKALATALAEGAELVQLTDVRDAEPVYDLVLDGILGIGAASDPALRGLAREVVETLLPAVRAADSRVVAVDLPSGLQPDDGTTADDAVLPASVTVTFGAAKAGLALGRGPEFVGEIVLVDLGLGDGLADDPAVAEASVARVIEG